MEWDDKNLIKVLSENGIAVMPTDTLYGIVGRAANESVVNKIYLTRKRSPEKPCIILIGDIGELEKFSINLSEEQKLVIKEYWPGPVSIIFDCFNEELLYLHRGTNSLAFRMPALEALRNLLLKVGPLIAPSANPEGLAPARSIDDAKKYFGDSVDLYIDGGVLIGKASKIIKLNSDGSADVLRE